MTTCGEVPVSLVSGRMVQADGRRETRLCCREHHFRRLYDEHVAAVTRYAARRVDDPTEVADVMAETFLVLWRRLEDAPTGSELPWLYGVARRVLANQYRNARRRGELVRRLGHEIAVAMQVESGGRPANEVDHDLARVRAALSGLSGPDQEILRLVAWEGLSGEQLAMALGCRAATARVRLHRARNRLRREVDRVGTSGNTSAGADTRHTEGCSALRREETSQ